MKLFLKQKKVRKVVIIIIVLLILVVAFFIESLYEAENFFYRYNQKGDVWICENPQLIVTYRSDTKGDTWLTRTKDKEYVTARFDGIEKEFLMDLGSGHSKQFNLFDRENDVYAFYGNYKMKSSNTFIVSIDDFWSEETMEYWNENYPEYASQIALLIDSDEELVFHKAT